nr:hypothetical protein [Tanacetum cinerariifolium]
DTVTWGVGKGVWNGLGEVRCTGEFPGDGGCTGIDMFDPLTFDFVIFVGFDFNHWARKGVEAPRVSVRGGSCIQYILGSQGSGSAPEPERSERVAASRHPTLTTWIDPEDGSQGSGSAPEPERSERVSASRHPTLTTWIDPEDAPSIIRSPILSPTISLIILSPIASHMATWTTTISVDEDQFIETAFQRELQEIKGRVTALEHERDRKER